MIVAKWKKTQVGSICKSKEDSRRFYLRIRNDEKAPDSITLRKGQYLNLESKEHQLEDLDKALSEERLSSDFAAKRRESIEKIPDFVMFSVSVSEKIDAE